jgi:hypothetical protein
MYMHCMTASDILFEYTSLTFALYLNNDLPVSYCKMCIVLFQKMVRNEFIAVSLNMLKSFRSQ